MSISAAEVEEIIRLAKPQGTDEEIRAAAEDLAAVMNAAVERLAEHDA